jgi:HK97 family phage portal protein
MAFVVTSGQLQTVQRETDYVASVGPFQSSLSLSPTLTMTYGALWRAQPALRSVTSFLARSVASLPLDPYRRLTSADREKASDHPLARLLDSPDGGRKWTKYRLLSALMHDLLVYDSAYWLKMKTRDGTPGLQPIPPTKITPRGGSFFETAGYRILGNRGYKDVNADQVVHFHGWNPDDQRTGCAPVETLRQILAEEHSASVYREQMWRNGARVSGYITRPAGAKWSGEARERFKGDWQAQYAGDGPATGGTPILEDGMAFEGSAVTPKDAQYVESRKLTREEVAVQYHVSPVMMGIIDGTTISSVMELHKMLYQDTLPPWLTSIAQDIECQLLPDLDPPGAAGGTVFVEFNLKAKLAGSFEEQAQALQSAVGGPWMVRNEARAMNNLAAVDGGDELIVPLNVVAGGLASPNDTAPDNPDNGPSNGKPPKSAELASVLRKHFERQGRVIASRFALGKSAGDLVSSRWDAELAADLAAIGADQRPVPAVNESTRKDLECLLSGDSPRAGVAALFAEYIDVRADQLAHAWGETS